MSDVRKNEDQPSLESRLAALRWAAAAGAWEVDYRSGRYYMAESIQRLLGDPPDYAPNFEDLKALTRVHPEDRAVLRMVLENATANHTPEVEECEFRIQHRDGGWVWLHSKSYILEWNSDGTPSRIAGWHTDITSRKRLEVALADALRQVERLTGTAFFERMACALTSVLQVRYCIVGKLTGERVTTVGFAEHGQVRPNIVYTLAGSPCEQTMLQELCFFPSGLRERFPADEGLRRLGAESYMGIKLTSSEGKPFGVISLLDDKPMPTSPMTRSLLPVFGARASAELERMQAEESSRLSQQQYRLLFEHLISACAVIEPVENEAGKIVDFRYVDVNPAFLTMTRFDPERVIGNTIRTMIPQVEDYWIDGMALVAKTGLPMQFEQYSRDYNRWYELRAFQPEPGRVAILFNDITERRNIENALRESERTLREMFENTQLAALIFDLEGRVTYCNESLAVFTGLATADILGQLWFERFITDEERQEILDNMEAAGGDWSRFPRHWRCHIIHANGSSRLLEWDHSPVYNAAGELTAIAGLGRDLSAWQELEEQYRQAQKMEAIGRLAGGIAHDFNNLLTVINGYSGLAMAKLQDGHEARHALQEIVKAGDRAAALTRQLLAFSRKQMFRLRVMSMNDVVNDALGMLSRLIGAHIQIECDLDERLRMVRADPGQMMQVLLNLAVNARDAIQEHGRITIRTYNHTVGADGDAMFPAILPGEYVGLMVADTGAGMDEETQRHLFEPFFTTKPAGEGTGLGLATVYGIVRQSGGAVTVRTRLGEGTAVFVLLPSAAGRAEINAEAPSAAKNEREGAILLVEDQDAVRNFLLAVLEESGFRVTSAPDGETALQLLREGLRPDVLVSDIVMPGISGPSLAEHARTLVPGLKVVLVSGYAPSHRKPPCDVYLQKPFGGEALLSAVRQLLAGEGD